MNKEKAVEIFDLVIKNKMLPEKIEELVPLSFIGQTAVSFYREKVALMDRLGIAEDQKRETLKDGQDAGRMLLSIETRIGELSYEEPSAKSIGLAGGGAKPSGQPPLHDEEETMGDKKQENELVRLIQILEGAGYRVLKAEIIQEPVRHGLIDITIRDSSASYISAI